MQLKTVNLPVEKGYYVVKNTLRENFGKTSHNSEEVRELTSSKASRWTGPTRIYQAFGCF